MQPTEWPPGRGASRQLKVLELLVSADRPMTTREVAERSDLPRPRRPHPAVARRRRVGGVRGRTYPLSTVVAAGGAWFPGRCPDAAADAMLQAGISLVLLGGAHRVSCRSTKSEPCCAPT